MAPHYGHGARRTARYTTHGGKPQHLSSVDSTQLRPQGHRTSTRRDGDRARESQHRHNRQECRDDTRLLCSPSPTVPSRRPSHLADRMTYDHGNDIQSPADYGDGDELPPRPQRGRSLLQRVTCDNGFRENGGPMQPVSQCGGHQGQAVSSNADSGRDNASIDIDDDFYDLFGTELPSRASTSLPPYQSINNKPVQYGSSYDLPFNLHLHPPRPVQPATRREPIRMVNSWMPHEPDIDGPAVASTAQAPMARGSVAKKRPVNTYKGNDPIKRAFTNAKLRAILADKSLPKPRKKADRMVLKCAGRREFR